MWNVNAAVKAILSKDILVLKGHGLGDTKWKGWAWNKLLIDIVMIYFVLFIRKRPFVPEKAVFKMSPVELESTQTVWKTDGLPINLWAHA